MFLFYVNLPPFTPMHPGLHFFIKIIIVVRKMGRKFALRNPRRNYGKPRKAMTVRVPRSRVMIYPVSVALDLVKLPSTSIVDATSLDQLSSMIVSHVPASWSFVKGSATLAFASFSTESNGLHMSFCLTIHEDFSWELSFEETIIPQQSLFMKIDIDIIHSRCPWFSW